MGGVGAIGGRIISSSHLERSASMCADAWSTVMKPHDRRQFLHLAAGAAALPAVSRMALAQTYPTRQILLIAPWPAGGAVDALCRILAPSLSDRLGQPVVVENRPGAGSVIGTAAGAKAAPDGYTMVMAGSGSLAISATMYKKLPYDP